MSAAAAVARVDVAGTDADGHASVAPAAEMGTGNPGIPHGRTGS